MFGAGCSGSSPVAKPAQPTAPPSTAPASTAPGSTAPASTAPGSTAPPSTAGSATTDPGQSIADEGAPDPAAATATSPLPARATPSSTSSACRLDPHAGVYRPQRLEVFDPCASISGTIRYTEPETDGDIHIGLAVDPQFTDHLNIWNHIWQQGQLLVEVVAADRHRVSIPSSRTHVTVVGPYVLDRAHGWMEIHPAWAMFF
jgi:hypothetical protein